MGSTTVSNEGWKRYFNLAQYACPLVLLVFFLLIICTYTILSYNKANGKDFANAQLEYGPGGKLLPRKKPAHAKSVDQIKSELDFSLGRKRLFYGFLAAAGLTYVANSAVVIIRALAQRKDGWWCGQPYTVHVVSNFFVYSVFLIYLLDTKPSPNNSHFATWVFATIVETAMVAASISVYTGRHHEHRVNHLPDYIATHMTDWEAAQVFVDILRILLLATLCVLYVIFVHSRNTQLLQAKDAAERQEAQESTRLLDGAGQANGDTNGTSYGTTGNAARPKSSPAPAGWEKPTEDPDRTWWEYLKGYKSFLPFLWPSKDRSLQLVVLLCVGIVIVGRLVNLLVPIETSIITNTLAGENGPSRLPWGHVLLYVLCRYLQGSQGVLGAVRSNLWIPVSQYSFRELSVASFEHVHGLSLDFHLGKKTGEVLSALGKGTSINNFLEQMTFSVSPMLIDLVVAVGYFLYKFDAYYALVVAFVTFWYIYVTIKIAAWRSGMRREMVNADRQEEAVKNDSMVSYETVKYFNAEPWEFGRYRKAVGVFQKAEASVTSSLNLLNVAQNTIFTLGLLAVAFIAAYQVASGQRRIGDFAALLQYMVQLQQPLNFFGTFYRMIQSNMINAERLLELFKEKPTVVDKPHAEVLSECEGSINFRDVNFAYDDRKPALNDLSFECKPGTTTALVGESGGGKSTVFRLLYRFYDQSSGAIEVDGHDVQDVTIDSLRQNIGVVPQDTVLFNETLMYNLKYANQHATDEDVFEACRKASIHEKILSFPDGYGTKVGERGLRLSGGEKQRVAIARTIIKNPRIILLDEATAALDTETEEHIQRALDTLGSGRTMLIIAHRLSTITTADQILVVRNGTIVEKGTHEELLTKVKSPYASMWRKQIRAQKAMEEAQVLKDKADRLKAEAREEGSPSSGEVSANQSDEENSPNGSPRALHDVRVRDFAHSRNVSSSSNLAFDDGKPPGHP